MGRETEEAGRALNVWVLGFFSPIRGVYVSPFKVLTLPRREVLNLIQGGGSAPPTLIVLPPPKEGCLVQSFTKHAPPFHILFISW